MIAAWENHVKVNNSKVIMTKAAAISSIDISDANNRIEQDERTEKANNNLVNNTGFERSDGKEFIHWNPDIALSVYKNGGIVVMSPASILFHEIVHLTDINLENNTITKYPGHENEFESSNGKMNYAEYLATIKTDEHLKYTGEQTRDVYSAGAYNLLDEKSKEGIEKPVTISYKNVKSNGQEIIIRKYIDIDNHIIHTDAKVRGTSEFVYNADYDMVTNETTIWRALSSNDLGNRYPELGIDNNHSYISIVKSNPNTGASEVTIKDITNGKVIISINSISIGNNDSVITTTTYKHDKGETVTNVIDSKNHSTTEITTTYVKNQDGSYDENKVATTSSVVNKEGVGKFTSYTNHLNGEQVTITQHDGVTVTIKRKYDLGADGKFDFENGAYDWELTSESTSNGEPHEYRGRFDPADPDNSSLPPGTGNNDNTNENGNNGNANENGNNGNANENGNNGNANENGNNGNANENGNNGNGNENGGNDNGNNPANPGGLPICTILGAFAGGIVGNKFGGPLGAIIGAGIGAQHGAKACGEPDPWKPPFPPLRLDPLSLDLNGDGKIGTLPLARGVHFDMDNSGFAEKLSWIAPEDGLLVNLADGATRVSNGSQLLGNETRLPSGELAADGFEALAALDDNGDGKVDAQDAAFAHLRVWQDKNSDGIASADELFTLESLGIFSLATAYDASTWTDANGVEHRGEGSFVREDASGLMQTLWFTADKVDSVAVDVHHGSSAGLPEAVTRLPNAAGFGNVDTLHRAMNVDADLRALVETFVTEADPAARQTLTEQILRRWAKADAVTGTRGALDARDLAVLEAFWGQPALAEQPTGAYARSVAQVYEDLKSLLHAQLSLQSHYREWYGLAQFRVQHGAWEINDTALADAIAQRFGAGSVNAATVGDFLDALQGLTPGNAALLQRLTVSVRQASAQLPQESRSTLHEVIHRGDDHITLADGEDFVNAGAGNDRIDGNAASNVIMDGAGNDMVHAGAGDDVLVSGRGDDSLDGGSGNDVYRFDRHSGHDTVHNVDNNPGRHDEIHLTGHDMTEVDISRVNNDLVIRGHDGDSSVTVRDHFNGAPVDAVRFSDDMVFDRAFLDKVARANSDPDYPDPTDWVESGQHELDALLHRLAHGAAEDNHAGLSGWNRLLDRLTQDANSPSDIGDVDRLIDQMEHGTAGKNATPPHQYDHHAHGTGSAHEHIDRLIDAWAGI